MKIQLFNDTKKALKVGADTMMLPEEQPPMTLKVYEFDAPPGAIPYIKIWDNGTVLVSSVDGPKDVSAPSVLPPDPQSCMIKTVVKVTDEVFINPSDISSMEYERIDSDYYGRNVKKGTTVTLKKGRKIFVKDLKPQEVLARMSGQQPTQEELKESLHAARPKRAQDTGPSRGV